MQLVFETTQRAFPEEHVEELEGDDGGESPDSVGLGFVQRERVPSTAAATSTAYSELGEPAGVLKKNQMLSEMIACAKVPKFCTSLRTH